MKYNLIKPFATGWFLLFTTGLQAQSYPPPAFHESDLNAVPAIPVAWIWLQYAIVPLAMLLIFIGAIIILAELHYRQNKMLNETLNRIAENYQKLDSTHE